MSVNTSSICGDIKTETDIYKEQFFKVTSHNFDCEIALSIKSYHMYRHTTVQLVQLKVQDERLQCIQCHFLLNRPLQLQCGHRLCTPCAAKLKQQRFV